MTPKAAGAVTHFSRRVYHSWLSLPDLTQAGRPQPDPFHRGHPGRAWVSGQLYRSDQRVGCTSLRAYDDDLTDQR